METLTNKLSKEGFTTKVNGSHLTVCLPNGVGYSVKIEKDMPNDIDVDYEFSVIKSIIYSLKNV